MEEKQFTTNKKLYVIEKDFNGEFRKGEFLKFAFEEQGEEFYCQVNKFGEKILSQLIDNLHLQLLVKSKYIKLWKKKKNN